MEIRLPAVPLLICEERALLNDVCEELLALELGLLLAISGFSFVVFMAREYDKRLVLCVFKGVILDGSSEAGINEDPPLALLPPVLFLALRTVTVGGI